MKISASLYSWNLGTSEFVQGIRASGVDYIHVDCKDDPSVFEDIEKLRSLTELPIDLHIITETPENYYDLIREHSVELVCFQFENLKPGTTFPSDLNCRLGLAICTGTSISEFDRYKSDCDFVMFMTTTPGESGGPFNKATFDEIRNFRMRFPSKPIHVDGGVNQEVGFALKSLGVACAVTGSYLAKSERPGTAVLALRSERSPSEVVVSDYMLRLNEVPVIAVKDLSLKSLLTVVDKGKMGFAVVVDDNGRATGVVSDGDIRRALMHKASCLEDLRPEDMINHEFLSVRPTDRAEDVLSLIASRNTPLLFAPVVGESGQLLGALSFSKLIQGDV